MKFFQILIILYISKIIISYGSSTSVDYIKAIVNHNIILNSDIKNRIKLIKHNAYDISRIDTIYYKNLYNIILDQLIIDNLILQIPINETIKIDSNQIDNIILSISHFKNMNIHEFSLYLNKIGLNYNKYYLEIYNNILKKSICNNIVHYNNHYQIFPNDMENIAQKLNFIDFNKQFKLIHTIIDLPIPTSLLQIHETEKLAKLIIKKRKLNIKTDTIMKEYYSNNILPQITVNLTDWISWKNIPVIFDQYLKTAKIGDIIGPIQSNDGIHILEIQDICTKNCIFPAIKVKINSIISKNRADSINIQEQLLKIKKQIEDSDITFSMIIKEKSQDFYSNNHINPTQWIDLDNFEPKVQKLLLSLKKNQISMPIYTNYGWCLIKLIDINKLNYSEMIYERAYSYLLQKKFNDILNNYIKELRSISYIKIIDYDEK